MVVKLSGFGIEIPNLEKNIVNISYLTRVFATMSLHKVLKSVKKCLFAQILYYVSGVAGGQKFDGKVLWNCIWQKCSVKKCTKRTSISKICRYKWYIKMTVVMLDRVTQNSKLYHLA